MSILWSKFKSHFTPYELKSFIKTFVATFAVVGGAQIEAVINGNFDKAALIALATAILRSAWKAIALVFLDTKETPIVTNK